MPTLRWLPNAFFKKKCLTVLYSLNNGCCIQASWQVALTGRLVIKVMGARSAILWVLGVDLPWHLDSYCCTHSFSLSYVYIYMCVYLKYSLNIRQINFKKIRNDGRTVVLLASQKLSEIHKVNHFAVAISLQLKTRTTNQEWNFSGCRGSSHLIHT